MPIWSDFSGVTDNDLTIDQLRAILRCNELADIKHFFIQRAEALNTYFNEKRWNEVVRAQYTARLNTNKINQSIFSIFNDGSVSYGAMSGGVNALGPISTAATAAGTIGVTSTIAIIGTVTGVSALVTIAIGVLYFASAYRKQKNENLTNIDEFALIAIKSACADLLINKYYQHKNVARPQVAPEPFHYHNKNKLDKVKDSFIPSTLIGFMAFGTFYLGTTTIVTTLSVSAAAVAFAGPIGLAAAFGAMLIVTAIMLFVFYRSVVNADKVKQLKAHNTDILVSKAEEINTLHNEYELNLEQAAQPQPVQLNMQPPQPVIVALPPQAINNFPAAPSADLLPPMPVVNHAMPPPPKAADLPPPPPLLMAIPAQAVNNNIPEREVIVERRRRNSAPILISKPASGKETEVEVSATTRIVKALDGGKLLLTQAVVAPNNDMQITASNLIPTPLRLEGSGEGNTRNARTSNASHNAARKH